MPPTFPSGLQPSALQGVTDVSQVHRGWQLEMQSKNLQGTNKKRRKNIAKTRRCGYVLLNSLKRVNGWLFSPKSVITFFFKDFLVGYDGVYVFFKLYIYILFVISYMNHVLSTILYN